MTPSSEHRRRSLGRALSVTLGVLLPLSWVGRVQADALPARPFIVAQAGEAASAPSKAAREQELEAIRAEQRLAAETEARLRRESETIGEDRRKLNEALIATASRLRAVEERISSAEARLKTLETNEQAVRNSLDA